MKNKQTEIDYFAMKKTLTKYANALSKLSDEYATIKTDAFMSGDEVKRIDYAFKEAMVDELSNRIWEVLNYLDAKFIEC
jgi:hypothetical protein